MDRNTILNTLIVSAYSIFVLVVVFISDGILETGDGIVHYQLAKFSWSHPIHFLDHWGKPLFTLMSSPFAQFGFNGMIIFNLLSACGVVFLQIKIAKQLGIKRTWTVVLCALCAPIYYSVILGGMTEVLFGLFMIAGIYLMTSGRHLPGAIIFSFLPFIRPEAYVVLPFFALFLALTRVKYVPFLLLGSLIYGVIGYIVFGDFMWFYTEDPYAHLDPGGYGTGPALHFLERTNKITGMVIGGLFLMGAGLVTYRSFNNTSNHRKAIWLLILLPAIFIFVTHSYLWWKGLHGSLGLIRVLATMTPLVAIVSALAFDEILNWIKSDSTRGVVSFAMAGLILVGFIEIVPFPIEYRKKEQLAIEAADWVKAEYLDRKVYYLEPLIVFKMDIDPYDWTKSSRIWSMDKERPSNSMSQGEIIIWDSHYGPQEGRMPAASAFNDDQLIFLRTFRPEEPLIIFNDREYELHIFERK